MTSKAEKLLSHSLRSMLDGLADGAAIDDSKEFRDVLVGLEFFLPPVLGEVYPFWKGESLDGVIPAMARKTGPGELELSGLCILMHDQTLMPIHVRLQISAREDEIAWLECRIGESGEGKGGMIRVPYGSRGQTKRLYAVADRTASIEWVYKVTFGRRIVH